jgi:DNA adenine methylase
MGYVPPERPALRWFGGKWLLAPWIIGLFPEHHAYVEPFAGALSVLLNKPPSQVEAASDLYGDVVEFFQVLREQPGDLIRAIKRTPYSAAEVTLAKRGQRSESRVERARQFFVLAWQTIGGPAIKHTDFRVSASPKNSYSVGDLWAKAHRTLPAVAARLRSVILDTAPASRMLARYDEPTTLYYVDPPYPDSTRSSKSHVRYRHEMTTEAEHAELLEQLNGLQAMVALSGYRSKLYDDQLAGWERHEVDAKSQKGRRRECLWLNPAAVERRLDSSAQLHLELSHGA